MKYIEEGLGHKHLRATTMKNHSDTHIENIDMDYESNQKYYNGNFYERKISHQSNYGL